MIGRSEVTSEDFEPPTDVLRFTCSLVAWSPLVCCGGLRPRKDAYRAKALEGRPVGYFATTLLHRHDDGVRGGRPN